MTQKSDNSFASRELHENGSQQFWSLMLVGFFPILKKHSVSFVNMHLLVVITPVQVLGTKLSVSLKHCSTVKIACHVLLIWEQTEQKFLREELEMLGFGNNAAIKQTHCQKPAFNTQQEVPKEKDLA